MSLKYFRDTPLDSTLISIVSGAIMLYIAAYSILILRKLDIAVISDIVEVWAGLAWGILIVLLGIMLYFDRVHHVAYGIGIMIFSIASIYGTNGGELVGLVLGFIAGIMAVEWKPKKVKIGASNASENK